MYQDQTNDKQKDGTLVGYAKKAGEILILPGNLVCDWFNIEQGEGRMLLRLFINLVIYCKIAVAFAFLLI